MALKCLLHFKNMRKVCFLGPERITCSRFSVLDCSIHMRRIFSKVKEKRFFRTSRLVASVCLALGGYYFVSNVIEHSPRKDFNFIADAVEGTADAVVRLTTYNSNRFLPQAGSGFIITNNGFIITNAHVVSQLPQEKLQVTLKDGRTFDGTLCTADVTTDLALVHINCENLPFLKLGSTKDLRLGEWVAAIGSPLCLNNSVTVGVVSSTQRRGFEIGFENQNMTFIQTDALINGGNSGGPLINLRGEVVGVNAMTAKPGISFAIPVEYVAKFVETCKKITAPKNYDVGLKFFMLDPHLVAQLNANGVQLPQFVKHGMYVVNVKPNSPAYGCGLRSGDVIFEVENRPIYNTQNFYFALASKDSVLVRLVREGAFYHTRLTPKRKA